MKLTVYSIKIKVCCSSDAEARAVQQVAYEISNDMDIVGADVVGFYEKIFKRNRNLVIPILKDVAKNGIPAISRHLLTLRKIK